MCTIFEGLDIEFKKLTLLVIYVDNGLHIKKLCMLNIQNYIQFFEKILYFEYIKFLHSPKKIMYIKYIELCIFFLKFCKLNIQNYVIIFENLCPLNILNHVHFLNVWIFNVHTSHSK